MKRFVSLLLTITLCVQFCVPAFAAEDVSDMESVVTGETVENNTEDTTEQPVDTTPVAGSGEGLESADEESGERDAEETPSESPAAEPQESPLESQEPEESVHPGEADTDGEEQESPAPEMTEDPDLSADMGEAEESAQPEETPADQGTGEESVVGDTVYDITEDAIIIQEAPAASVFTETTDGTYADTAILYSDGTLVFQIGDTEDEAHGTVTATFTDFNSTESIAANKIPWYSYRASITAIDFAAPTHPSSTAYWFYGCTKLTEIQNIENLDVSDVRYLGHMFYNCKSLTSLDITGFDTSNAKSFSEMFYNCSGLTELDVTGFDTSSVTNMSYMFYSCSGLTQLDVSGFDTTNVTTMASMFDSCSGLTELDVSGFDTSACTSMSRMFAGCSGLTTIDVSGFITSSVTTMLAMFSDCSALTELDVTSFNTSLVTDMGCMFSDCSSLTALDVTHLTTSKATSLREMFGGCSGITALDVSGFDISNAYTTSGMFKDCSSLTSLDISSFTGANTLNSTNRSYMFQNCSGLTELDVSSLSVYTAKTSNLEGMFRGCSSLTTLDLSMFDTTNATNMSYMFYGCSSLTSLDLSGAFTTAYVTDMERMFASCGAFTSMDVSGLDTSSATTMDGLFERCSGLKEITFGGLFTTTSVTSMDSMFSCCSGLETLDISALDTSNVTNMRSMFYGCAGINTLDVSTMDTSKVTNMGTMFCGCSLLTDVNATMMDTSCVTDMSYMFDSCTSLTSIDLTGMDTTAVKTMKSMFGNCSSLKSVDLSGIDTPSVTTLEDMFYNDPSLIYLDISGIDTTNVSALTSMTGLRRMFYKSYYIEYLSLGPNWTWKGTDNYLRYDVTWYDMETGVGYDESEIPDGAGRYVITEPGTSDVAILYEDGTLVFQIGETPNAERGTALKIYRGFETDDSLAHDVPWKEERDMIVSVDFDDMTRPSSMLLWFAYCSNLKEIKKSELFDTSRVCKTARMFENSTGPVDLDLSWLDFNAVTNMSSMFNGCSNLVSLQMPTMTSGRSISLWYMFDGCSSLVSLDLSGLYATGTGNLDYMFNNCSSLVSLDISGIDGTAGRSMPGMFSGCSKLSSLTLGANWVWNGTSYGLRDVPWFDAATGTRYKWNTIPSNTAATYVTSMFSDTAILYSDGTLVFQQSTAPDPDHGDVVGTYTGFDTKTYTSSTSAPWHTNAASITTVEFAAETRPETATAYWFDDCVNLTEIKNIGNLNTSMVTTMEGMFCDCDSLTALDVTGFDTSNVTNISMMFCECGSLEALDLSAWDTSNMTRMTMLFYNCEKLFSLDLTGFDTSSVEQMWTMFYGCKSLTSLDLSSFETSQITSLGSMFAYCTSLKELDLSSFKTTNVQSFLYMFKSCTSLESLDLSGFDTSSATNMSYMFNSCSSLKTLDLSGFDTSNVTNMSRMFSSCSKLESLDLSGFDTSGVTDMSYMFNSCSKLESLDLSGFDTSNVTKATYMFTSSSALRTVTLGEKFAFVGTTGYLPNNLPDYCWYDVNDVYTAYKAAEIPSNKATTYVAERPTYTITFDTNGGDQMDAVTAPAYSTIEEPEPTRQGYMFAGWSDSEGAAVTFPMTVTGDITLTATWTPATDTPYTVIIRTEDVDGNFETQTLTRYGTTGETVEAEYEVPEDGFYLNEDDSYTTGVVAADGSLTLTVTICRYWYYMMVYTSAEDTEPTAIFRRYGTVIYKDDYYYLAGDRPGYTLMYWKHKDKEGLYYTDVTLTTNIDIIPVWEPNQYTPYVVEKRTQTLDAAVYDITTETLYGPTDETVTAKFSTPEGFHVNNDMSVLSGAIAGDESLKLVVVLDRNTYTVAIGDAEPYTALYGASIMEPGHAEKQGYNFIGWQDAEGNTVSFPLTVTGNVALTAAWAAATNTPYTVETRTQKVDLTGYDSESVTGTGTTGESVTAAYTVPEGFHLNTEASVLSGEIAADGSLALVVVFDRNMITVTIGDGQSEEVPYGTVMNEPETPTRDGYIFNGWVDEDGTPVTFPIAVTGEDVTVVPTWIPSTDTKYTVETRTQTADGTDYTSETAELRGTTDTEVYAAYTLPEGFHLNEESVLSGIVAADGSLAMVVILDRDLYAVTIGGGEPVEMPYGASIEEPEAPTKQGYEFAGWQDADGNLVSFPLTITGEAILTPVWNGAENTPYTVETRTQTVDRAGYDIDTVTAAGTTDTVVTADYTMPEGFHLNAEASTLSGAIAGDGSLKLVVVFDRDMITVSIGDGETMEVPYGTTIDAPETPVKDGYVFDGWVDEAGDPVTFPLTVTGETIIIVPKWTETASSSGSSSSSVIRYTVTFETNGGSSVKAQKTTGKVTEPDAPVKEGAVFSGWYTDKDLTTAFDFSKRIKKNTTLYARWEEAENPASSGPFTADHIAYINGREDGKVYPESNITRAEVAAIFYRLLTEDIREQYETEESPFTDVDADDWFVKEVSTLANMGALTGRGDGVFDPQTNITRAEFAVICDRLAGNMGEETNTNVSFPDVPETLWSAAAIYSAAAKGWVKGYEDGTFRPDNPITRAETVTILNRVLGRDHITIESIQNRKDMRTWEDNMDASAWYYLPIQEAGNSHSFDITDDTEIWTAINDQ